ncbi:MAG: hypothetical protein AAFY65_09175 [Pseudomonadota bacterium]
MIKQALIACFLAPPALADPLSGALEGCVAYVLEDRAEGRAKGTQGYAAGGVFIERVTQYDTADDFAQCSLFGIEHQKGELAIGWADGASMVNDWLQNSPVAQATTIKGWAAPITPVLGCGAVQVMAQPMRAFTAADPFYDSPPDARPVEITITRPAELCARHAP